MTESANKPGRAPLEILPKEAFSENGSTCVLLSAPDNVSRPPAPPDRERLAAEAIEELRRFEHINYLTGLKLIAALRSPADGWRNIESAPKDGTRVQVWRPRVVHDGCTYVGHVDADRWVGNSWWESRRIQQPTHWRPLPFPPAEEKTP